MNIEPKTELERLREQLEGCLNDLVIMGSPEGQPAIIQINIRHKREQVRQLEEQIKALEGTEGKAGEEAPPWA